MLIRESVIDNHKDEVIKLLNNNKLEDEISDNAYELMEQVYKRRNLPYVVRNLFLKQLNGKFDEFESVKMFFLQISDIARNKKQYSTQDKIEASALCAQYFLKRLDSDDDKTVVSAHKDIDLTNFEEFAYRVEDDDDTDTYDAVKNTIIEMIRHGISNTFLSIFSDLAIKATETSMLWYYGYIVVPSYTNVLYSAIWLYYFKNATVDNLGDFETVLETFNDLHETMPEQWIWHKNELDYFKEQVIGDEEQDYVTDDVTVDDLVTTKGTGEYFYCEPFGKCELGSTGGEVTLQFVDKSKLVKLLNKDLELIDKLKNKIVEDEDL